MYQRKVLLSEPGSAFVRISQGCARTCSFCAIPGIMAGLTSRVVESLVREVRALSTKHKVHEINLVAQDLTSFGTDRGKNQFLALLQELDTIDTVRWFRLHYVYPFGLTRPMLEFVARSKRFARYIDMPFQHGDDTMLKVMRRGGSMRGNLEYIRQVREAIPGLALRTTILVGHPRETERRFENLLAFLGEAAFEWLGVFPYSPEENTHSHGISGRIPKQVQDERVQRVMEVYRASRGLEAFRLGQVKDALVVENDGENELVLRSETEAPEVDGLIRAPRVDGVKAGDLVSLRLLEDDDLDFRGEIVSRPDNHKG
jgi:ribosomal protein S12 methylthiotransferase